MTRKFAGLQDYAVGKLEGQWFFDGDPAGIPKERWRWKLIIRTPDFIKPTDLKKAVATLLKSGKPAEVKDVKLERIAEGRRVQMLHVGPHDREGETTARMKAFAEGQGLRFAGPYHKIYLSDPRRVPAGGSRPSCANRSNLQSLELPSACSTRSTTVPGWIAMRHSMGGDHAQRDFRQGAQGRFTRTAPASCP
jgi:effector-binding domain-containing protein